MAAVSVSRAVAAFPELTGRQLLTQFFRSIIPFLNNSVITVVYSVETGFVEGLRDSVWPPESPLVPLVCACLALRHGVSSSRVLGLPAWGI